MAHSLPAAGWDIFYLDWISPVPSSKDKIAALLSKSPREDELAQEVLRLVRSLVNTPLRLTELVGPCCTTPELVAWLGISRQGIHKAATENRLVAVQLGRTWYYPTWQMRPDRALDKNIGKIHALLRQKMGPVEAACWWASGETPPKQAIFSGDTHKLMAQARKASSHGEPEVMP